MVCPKCHGHMQTFNRNGVQIEQCDTCRGIFLDYGELESLTRLEGQWAQPMPPQGYAAAPGYPQAPAWGAPHHVEYRDEHVDYVEHYDDEHYEGHREYGHHGRHGGFAHMLFSS